MDPAAPSLAELLAHAGWAHELARELVADRSRAEDVVQETWLAALREPPAHGANPRGWLRAVLRNAARQLGRGETRRARRERERATPEALPAADELVAAVEWQQRIAAAVLALEEPYRETLILRFYRDLAPHEIARAQGVPDGTVRSRLKRGLDELRARFDREAGERDAWCALLVPWAGRGASRETLVASAGSWLALKLLLALLVVSGATLVAYREFAHDTRAHDALEPALVTDSVRANDPPVLETGSAPEPIGEREPVAEARPETALPTPDTPAYVGRVHAPDDSPIAGATLKIYPNKNWPRPAPIGVGTSDADGRFRIVAGPTSSTYIMIAEADGFQGNQMEPVVPEQEISVELRWMVQVSGVVRDSSSGAALAGVAVDNGLELARSDEHGNYRFLVAEGFSRSVRVRVAGYVAFEHEVFVRGKEAERLDLELTPGTPLEVDVVDAETLAPLALVAVSDPYRDKPWAHTDEHGRFQTWIGPEQEVRLELALDDYWPLAWDWTPGPRVSESTLRLGMIRKAWTDGRITDEQGQPLHGVTVYAESEDEQWRRAALPEELQALGTPGEVRYGAHTLGGVESDADGRYRYPILASEEPFTLKAGRKGFVDARHGPFVFARSTEHASVDFQLAPAASIHGRLVHDGKGWNGRILCRSLSGELVASAWVDGKYALDNVPAGTWRLTLDDRVHRKTEDDFPSFELTVEAGRSYEHDLLWDAEAPPGTITGRVHAARGPLPASVFVGAHPADDPRSEGDVAAIDAQGNFVLHVRRGVTYSVGAWVARSPQQISEPRVVTSDAEDVELVLPEVGKLRLRLIDARTRKPVEPGARLVTDGLRWRHTGDEGFRSDNTQVDLQGCLELEVPVGACDVRIDLNEDGYRPASADALLVTSDPAEPPHVLELTPGLDAHVRLIGPQQGEQKLLEDHLLFLVESAQLASISGPYPDDDRRANQSFGGSHGIHLRIEEESLMHQLLGEDGFFRDGALLRGLVPGRYFLKSFPDDLVFEPAEFDVVGPGRTEITAHWRAR